MTRLSLVCRLVLGDRSPSQLCLSTVHNVEVVDSRQTHMSIDSLVHGGLSVLLVSLIKGFLSMNSLQYQPMTA